MPAFRCRPGQYWTVSVIVPVYAPAGAAAGMDDIAPPTQSHRSPEASASFVPPLEIVVAPDWVDVLLTATAGVQGILVAPNVRFAEAVQLTWSVWLAGAPVNVNDAVLLPPAMGSTVTLVAP